METGLTPLPFFFVSQDTVDERTAGFASEKLPLLTTALGKPDTKSIWYSREHIALLLSEIDLVSGDGLRVFFARYEPGHQFEGQLCLVMNPTRKDGVAGHSNVILENEPDFGARSSQPRDITLDDEETPRGIITALPARHFVTKWAMYCQFLFVH